MTISRKTGRSRLFLGAAAVCVGALVPAAAQACTLSVEPVQDQLIIRHNPLEDGAAFGTLEINIVNRGDGECVGRLGASLRGETFGFRSEDGAAPIPYQLVDEKGSNDITPRAGRNIQGMGGRLIRLMPGERTMELLSVAAAPDSATSQGRYTQSLDLTVSGDDGMLLGTRPLTLGIDVLPAAMIGLKGQLARARGTNSVDLGELVPGTKDLPITLYVISTGGYRVSVVSENQGRLKHENAGWYVDYRLRMGRFDLDLTSPAGFEIVSNRARFDNYPVRIEIGETAGKRAGGYMDTVTFTVAAL
ncbi:hypothetical protein [Sphingopyxis sp. H115]|uniref:hypothetical protein n=1 Tax=Sphingopyxis sp. H115 TaxID=1759073 RepID=UPI000736064C|nr:hypothetical protein [Sphingopyxis sp. H115]KTE17355.1 hypothetical protein ATE71_02185 [Sphingopyxis sp. H115]